MPPPRVLEAPTKRGASTPLLPRPQNRSAANHCARRITAMAHQLVDCRSKNELNAWLAWEAKLITGADYLGFVRDGHEVLNASKNAGYDHDIRIDHASWSLIFPADSIDCAFFDAPPRPLLTPFTRQCRSMMVVREPAKSDFAQNNSDERDDQSIMGVSIGSNKKDHFANDELRAAFRLLAHTLMTVGLEID